MEDLLTPDPKKITHITPKLEYTHITLSDHIYDWLIGSDDDLDIPQMRLVASEMEDYYKVRRQSILKAREEPPC
ncbi:hypothetical protein D3C78_1961230 [compost metagenome]